MGDPRVHTNEMEVKSQRTVVAPQLFSGLRHTWPIKLLVTIDSKHFSNSLVPLVRQTRGVNSLRST